MTTTWNALTDRAARAEASAPGMKGRLTELTRMVQTLDRLGGEPPDPSMVAGVESLILDTERAVGTLGMDPGESAFPALVEAAKALDSQVRSALSKFGGCLVDDARTPVDGLGNDPLVDLSEAFHTTPLEAHAPSSPSRP